MKIKKITSSIFLKAAVCFFTCYVTQHIQAQNQKKIDSLKHIIASTKNDTVKLNALVILNEINQNRKELKEGYTQQIALSIKIKEYTSASLGYSRLGYYEFENNNFAASEKLLNQGMALARRTNDDLALGRISNSMMGISDKKGDMAAALNYLKQGEMLLIKVNKMVNLTRLYCNASDLFRRHTLSEKALEYARKAYATAQASGELEPVTTASWYLASRLQTIGKYDSAIYYFSQGLKIAEKLGLVYTQGDMFRGLSDVNAELKKYNSAKGYLKKAVARYDSVNVTDRIIDCEESLAYLNFMNKDFNKVKDYMLIRENRFTEDSLNNKKYVNKWLANLALIDDDVEKWKKYYSQFEKADDALMNERIQKNLLELETKYNLSRKESELLQKDTENRKRLWIIVALAIGLLGIIIITVIQYRNFKYRQKIVLQKSIIENQHALAEERFRIAADMHDDVGAGLSRIRYISASLQPNLTASHTDITKIVSLSDELVEKMNEIIWALNQGNQPLEELIFYTRSQCSEMVGNAGLAFTFDLPEEFPDKILDWKDCRNIYLLIKEAVNNAIKHAGATSIVIECNITKQLQLSVTDNGNGFDPDIIKKTGNGLLNYKKRAENLNGTYQLTTVPGKGTKLLFCIPLYPVT